MAETMTTGNKKMKIHGNYSVKSGATVWQKAVQKSILKVFFFKCGISNDSLS